jgi:hypothetical protein
METELKHLIEINAAKESWLPDLVAEFMALHPDASRTEAIRTLGEAVRRPAVEGVVGVFSYTHARIRELSMLRLRILMLYSTRHQTGGTGVYPSGSMRYSRKNTASRHMQSDGKRG